MDTWKNHFNEISAGESVLVVGGVDGNLKELLYNLAFFVGRFVRLVFGPRLPV